MDMMIYFMEDGGVSFEWLNICNKYVDNYFLLFDFFDFDYLMVGSDGGLYESWDKGNSWKYVVNLLFI